jgi:hypothetical protein
MRRQGKTSSNVVKILSATALVAALTAGTVPVYAGEANIIQVGNSMTFPRIEVSALESPEYRDMIIQAFLANESVVLYEEGVPTEISKDITLDDWANAKVNEISPDQIAVFPYVDEI